MKTLRWLMVAGLLCGPLAATEYTTLQVTSQYTREIKADLDTPTTPRSQMFRFCVGGGRAYECLNATWQHQLKQCHDEIGFQYVRFHDLFHEEMGVYAEDWRGRPHINWQFVDLLLDYLMTVGVKPIINISPMPRALASGEKYVFWWHANITPPKSYKRWADLITSLMEHLLERYGAHEINRWYFEVWNKPNLEGYWAGTQRDYINLYECTAQTIKSVAPDCRVGGPASAYGGGVEDLIYYCAKNNIPLDFITAHAFNTIRLPSEQGAKRATLDENLHAVADTVAEVRTMINGYAPPTLPLLITEWGISSITHDAVHDAYFTAPFILDQIKRSEGKAEAMSYWTFTDLFQERGAVLKPFHGGLGLLNMLGIRKPAYHAYQLLCQLGGQELPHTDKSAWVCTDGHGSVQVLCWDLSTPAAAGERLDEELFKQDLPARYKGQLRLSLRGLKPGIYTLEVHRIGYEHNDPYTAYLKMGAPEQLTRVQENLLRKVSDGAPVEIAKVTVANDGVFLRTFVLHENDVWLLNLTPDAPPAP